MRSFVKMTAAAALLLSLSVVSALAARIVVTTYDVPPPGFAHYVVKSGDSWESIVQPEDKLLAMRTNRLDEVLVPGSTIVIPVSSQAYSFVPVPKRIASTERQMIVFLQEQYFGLYENGQLFHWGPISSGRRGNTPIGNFRALWKDRWHRSSLYHNALMYYGIQFRGNFFTHQTTEMPGYPASAGCVRMLEVDAAIKWEFIREGDPIKVRRSVHDVIALN